jgi:hypothetical protein
MERIVALQKAVGYIEQRELLFGCNILKYEVDVVSSLSCRHTFRNQDLSICVRSLFATPGDKFCR